MKLALAKLVGGRFLNQKQPSCQIRLVKRSPILDFWMTMQYKALRCILAQSRQPDKMAYATKAKTQQFSRRRPSLIKKADQLARLCNADVAVIIRRNGRYYTYRSIDHEQWPPARSEIVGKNLNHSTLD